MADNIEKTIEVDFKVDGSELKAGLKKAESAVNQSMSKMKKTVAGMRSIINASLGLAFKTAAVTVGSSLGLMARSGFNYKASMEDARGSLEAMIRTTVSYQDTLGEMVSVQERNEIVSKMATDTLSNISAVLPDTAMGMNELVTAFSMAKPAMDQFNISMNDQVEIMKLASNSATNFQMDSNELLSGIDGLASGVWVANSAFGRMMQSLGITKEGLAAAGDRAAYLKEKLKESGIQADTMRVASSNLNEAFSVMNSTLMSGAYDVVKNAMNELSHVIGINGVEAANAFKGGMASFAKGAISSIGSVINAVLSLIGVLNKAMNGIAMLGQAVKGVGAKMGSMIGTAIGSLDTRPSGTSWFKRTAQEMKDFYVPAVQNARDAIINLDVQNMQFDSTLSNLSDTVDASVAKMTAYEAKTSDAASTATRTLQPTKNLAGAIQDVGNAASGAGGKAKAANKAVSESVRELGQLYKGIQSRLEQGFGDALLSIVDKTKSFKEAMRSMLADVAKMIMKLAMSQLFNGFLGSVFKGFSGGMFAQGGIVNSPTMFSNGGRPALMGERGPEAIMPVSRTSGGDLGVKVESSPVNVNVINNSSESVDIQQDQRGTIDIIIGKIAADIASGSGILPGAFESRYALAKG